MEAYKKLLMVSTIVAAILIIALIFYFFYIQQPASQESNEAVPGPVEPATASTSSSGESQEEPVTVDKEPPDPLISDIRLSDSDEPVRELAADCSTHPDFNQWLKNKNIIRRCVAIVDNVANGNSPAPNLQFLLPTDGFKVIKKNGEIILDPTSYIRYQPIAMVLVSLDSEKLVKIYQQLVPLIEDAYRELGYPTTKFQQTLEQALDLLLKTPIPHGDILLTEKVTTYAFADPRLEVLNDAQKHLLRMGPQNVREIKTKLREIKKALKKREDELKIKNDK